MWELLQIVETAYGHCLQTLGQLPVAVFGLTSDNISNVVLHGVELLSAARCADESTTARVTVKPKDAGHRRRKRFVTLSCLPERPNWSKAPTFLGCLDSRQCQLHPSQGPPDSDNKSETWWSKRTTVGPMICPAGGTSSDPRKALTVPFLCLTSSYYHTTHRQDAYFAAASLREYTLHQQQLPAVRIHVALVIVWGRAGREVKEVRAFLGDEEARILNRSNPKQGL